jgi:hypothetical protein
MTIFNIQQKQQGRLWHACCIAIAYENGGLALKVDEND